MAHLIVIAGPDTDKVGKDFAVAHGDTVGSSPNDSIVLTSENILPGHFKISISDKTVHLSTTLPNATVMVNGEEVRQCQLAHGDYINLDAYTLMVDEEKETIPSSPVNAFVHSRIESRQKYYDSEQHMLASLETEESQTKGKVLTLYKVANAISGILDLDHLLQKFLEIILEEFSADRGFIMLLTGNDRKLVPAAILCKRQEAGLPTISRSIVDEVLSTKESIISENMSDDTRFKAQQSIISHNILSAMCVPLVRQGEVLGLLHVDSKQRNKFSRPDLDLLTKVAMHAAIVIENAKFYKARQQFNKNLLTLSHATQTLSSYLREDLIVQDATLCAAKIFQAKRSYLFLKEKENLSLCHAIGLPKEKWAKIVVPASLAEVASGSRPLIGNDWSKMANDLLPLLDGTGSVMAVHVSRLGEAAQSPAQTQQPSMGVLCVANRENGEAFTTEDMQLLSILASYTAIALANSRFYQELKRKEEEIATWNCELEQRVADRTAELKSTQGQLVQSEKMAAVGLLAAGVAHEFNNIIASMYGFAQIAKKNSKYQEKLVDIVVSQSQRARDITENLLSFSKQRGDRLELTDVKELVDTVLHLIMTALENEGIVVETHFENVPKILINAGKVQQVFLNIIINARHAIDRNGKITIKSFIHDNQWVHVSFEDTGKGIEPQNLSKIFEPFYTTKGSFGGGTQPGTGLGLSLCYNIIRQHGGNITVSSTVGKGSCFTVIFPLRTEALHIEETAKLPPSPAVKLAAGLPVLVVEDTKDIQELLCNVLEEKGHTVYRVASGAEAIELCQKERFALVFLDIRMPGMVDGFGVFDTVKKLEPNTKIILITGRAEDATLMRYVGYADGYLRKPFEIEDIYRILQNTKEL